MPSTIASQQFRDDVGVVEEVGAEVHSLKPGDRVIVPFNIFCGEWWKAWSPTWATATCPTCGRRWASPPNGATTARRSRKTAITAGVAALVVIAWKLRSRRA
jgi:Zn-dependent alcohol dehydrogenase